MSWASARKLDDPAVIRVIIGISAVFGLPPALALLAFRLPFEVSQNSGDALLIFRAEPVDRRTAHWLWVVLVDDHARPRRLVAKGTEGDFHDRGPVLAA